MENVSDKDDQIVGKQGIFDGKDELLFMMKDAGLRKTNFMKADGDFVSEISVDNSLMNPEHMIIFLF